MVPPTPTAAMAGLAYFRQNTGAALRYFLARCPRVRSVQVRPAAFAHAHGQLLDVPVFALVWVVGVAGPPVDADALAGFDGHPVMQLPV